MKFQLFLLSAILISALAHPVPDEEVSPVKAALPAETNPDLTQKPLEKPDEKTGAATPALEENKLDKKLPEKLPSPEITPDAEIKQAIPEKKEEKLAIEKQTRAEDKISSDVKTIPVVQTPVAGIEADKQIVEEPKPAVEEVQPVGKKAEIAAEAPAVETAAAPEATISEQKKDELSAIETGPAVKSELPIAAAETPVALAEDKKEEQPARQERVNEEEAKKALPVETVKPADAADANAPTPVNAEVKPEVKSLTPAEEIKPEPSAEKPQEAIAPISELKSEPVAAVVKPAEPAPAAGDIPASQIAPESNIKGLPTEAEKPAASPALSATPEAKNIEEKTAAAEPLATLPETPVPGPQPAATLEGAEPLKKLEDKPAAEEKKSEESKESKESDSDSKESEESKENKSN